ncbi:MAG: NADH-quinone oxidoreductase subunit J [Actinobacteria bacterium]|nr:MAG: NADH-quinone oxidoreductase subunit J [Actinomycetota bacterium]
MIAQNIAFGVIAATMVGAAIRLVTTQNVVRAALFLVLVLAGAAAQFLLLSADFVAIVQVLVYIGAIVVLFLFGIMLTRAPIGRDVGLDNEQRWLAALVGALLLGVIVYVTNDAFGSDKINFGRIASAGHTTPSIAVSIFQSYVVPFEVVSVLLLAALVGSIVVARRD